MKLRNKKTGEIVETSDCDLGIMPFNSEIRLHGYNYNSLAELCEEWTDYEEEPKEHFVITCDGKIITTAEDFTAISECEEIGNKFETEEEAEKAVEKLKALTRLENAGFVLHCGNPMFDYQGDHHESIYGMAEFEVANYESVEEDLRTIFGGEE